MKCPICDRVINSKGAGDVCIKCYGVQVSSTAKEMYDLLTYEFSWLKKHKCNVNQFVIDVMSFVQTMVYEFLSTGEQ